MKQTIAVFFGGRSPEHDVCVITALQAMEALDSARYTVIPVYIAPDGRWLAGDSLRKRESYIPKPNAIGIHTVRLDLSSVKQPRLMVTKSGFFTKEEIIPFDVALLAVHGLFMEDGGLQGLLEMANVPYTGARLLASSLFMDKIATKYLLASLGIPCLPFAEIRRPPQGTFVDPSVIADLVKDLTPPYCVKPAHLGSSIGVGKAQTPEDIAALLPAIFAYDPVALVEPFVPNMVEYNVAVARFDNRLQTSAIEKPKRVEELLNFKEKYISGGGKKMGSKLPGQSSEGMLSLTREINPPLPPETEKNIRAWALRAFDSVLGAGAPRIDFIGNEATGEIWFNEVNPCPGSFGYFLWEARAADPILFSSFLDKMIEEALTLHRRMQLPAEPVPEEARLLKR